MTQNNSMELRDRPVAKVSGLGIYSPSAAGLAQVQAGPIGFGPGVASLSNPTQTSPLPARSSWAATLAAGVLGVGLFTGSEVEARSFRVNMMPNGSQLGCGSCHVSAGGGGPRNSFGQAVGAITGSSSAAFWTPTLAALDSDGDGFANGVELGDPEGDGQAIAGSRATNPGSASSRPTVVNQAPTVSLSGWTEGTTLIAPSVAAVTALAADSDGRIASLEFFSNGKLLGTLTNAPFSLLVDWPLGPHSVTARAVDDKGLATVSSALTMTVRAPDPTTLQTPVLAVAGNAAEVKWEGGSGPFAVQGRSAMADPWCSLTDVTTNRAASVPLRGLSSQIRIADLATVGVIPMSVAMKGAFERPAEVATAGVGSGTLKIEGSTLTFDIQYGGLSGPATAAHIHGPGGLDESVGVMIDLAPFNGGAFGVSGKLAGSVILTPAQKASILSGKTYVNVHTAANRPGEIRGQVVPLTMLSALSGDNERPNRVSTPGSGAGQFRLSGDQLTFEVSYSGLSGPATAAHIHGPADADGAAGVMIDLAPFNGGAFGTSGTLAGTVTLTPAQFLAVASGRTYVNVHTGANRAGEIRGQIVPCATALPFSATLSGDAERPNPVVTSGTGSTLMALEGSTLGFVIRYSGLSGPATAAHIHGPADATASAGVLIDLKPFHVGDFAPSGSFFGSVILTEAQKTAVLAGLTYVNIHTDANRPGEIRGQLNRTIQP